MNLEITIRTYHMIVHMYINVYKFKKKNSIVKIVRMNWENFVIYD